MEEPIQIRCELMKSTHDGEFGGIVANRFVNIEATIFSQSWYSH